MPKNSIYPLSKTIEFRFKMYPKDFYRVKEFYEKVLEYPIIESWGDSDDKGVMFNTGAAVIEIMTPRDNFIPPIQGTGLALMVEDVWILWERLKDNPNIIKPLKDQASSWGDISFRIADPEGFQITFFTPARMKK